MMELLVLAELDKFDGILSETKFKPVKRTNFWQKLFLNSILESDIIF